MKIYNEISAVQGIFKNPVLTIGTFDGVHTGHQKILETMLIIAAGNKAESVVLTFDIHPRKVLYPATPPRILTTVNEKIKAISDCGIDNIIILKFNKETADMHAGEFLNMIIEKIGIAHLVVGYDHAFGKDRNGNFNFVNEIARVKGFEITMVKPRNFHSAPVSSTWIRAEIEDGNISFANTLLGRHYTLFGRVIKGDGRGTGLGFPTANIVPEDQDKIIPKDGVYAVKVVIDNSLIKDGMLNIGTNPTFSNTERSIEVNIFDFNKDIYKENIEIDFFERIRDEIKFNSPEALMKQLYEDRQIIQKVLRKDIDIPN